MTSRPNARQIVEKMLLPAALTTIVALMLKQFSGEDGDCPELSRAHELLVKSLEEPIVGLPPGDVQKLVRRTKRAAVDALAPLFEKYPLATLYLTLAYLISELTIEEKIIVGAESPFAEAWDIMTEVMDRVVDKLPEMDVIATAEAQCLRHRLEASGYFRK